MATPTKPLAVVTGASSGIGLELAKQFADHDFDLVVSAENAQLAEAARLLRERGAGVEEVQVDLASFDGVEQLMARVEATGRPIEAVAINAGVSTRGDVAGDADLRTLLNIVNLNVTSAVHLAQRATTRMAARGAGRVLFTSSIAATAPIPHNAVYSASKAFITTFAEALRLELKDRGVTVTALLPGPTDTEFFERADMTDTKVGAGKKDDPAEVARQGFDALMKGEEKVVAGSMTNKLQAAMARVSPDRTKATMMGKMHEPGSASEG